MFQWVDRVVQCFKKVVFSRLVLVNFVAQYEYSILCLPDGDIFVEAKELLFCGVVSITYRLS